jgi:hypothetical protein
MKEAMWAMCPTGEFEVRVGDQSSQYQLRLGFELEPLKEYLMNKYKDKSASISELEHALDETPFLKKHLHDVLHSMQRSGEIALSEPLVFKRNPTVVFRSKMR